MTFYKYSYLIFSFSTSDRQAEFSEKLNIQDEVSEIWGKESINYNYDEKCFIFKTAIVSCTSSLHILDFIREWRECRSPYRTLPKPTNGWMYNWLWQIEIHFIFLAGSMGSTWAFENINIKLKEKRCIWLARQRRTGPACADLLFRI